MSCVRDYTKRLEREPKRLSEWGFTVLDMVVSLAVIAILSAAALPQLATFDAAFHRMNARSYVIQDLKRAQAESITKGCRGIFTIASGGRSYSFGCDFLSYDTDDPPSADGISFTRTLPGDVVISTDSQIIFNSRGLTVDTADVMLTINITLSDGSGASRSDFAAGTLLGTGVFSFS